MPYVPEHRIGPQQSKGFQFKCLNGASPGFVAGQAGPANTMKNTMDAWETQWGTPIEAVAIGLSNGLTTMNSSWITAMQNETRFKVFATPLIPKQSGASMHTLVTGGYDTQIKALFNQLVTNGLGGLDVCCRIGWEYNSGAGGSYTGFPWATGVVDPNTGVANGVAGYKAAAQYFENLIRTPSSGLPVGYSGYIEWNVGTQDTSAASISSAFPMHATGINKAKTLVGWDLYPSPPYNVGKDNVASTWTAIQNIWNGYLSFCRTNGYMMCFGEFGQTYKASSPYSLNDVTTWFPLFYAKLAANADVCAYATLYHENQNFVAPGGTPNILDESHMMWGNGGFQGSPSTLVGSGPYPVGASALNSTGSAHTIASMGSLHGANATPTFWTPTTDANKVNALGSFMNTFGGNVAGKGSPGLQAPVTNPATSDNAPATDTIKVTSTRSVFTQDYAVTNMLVSPGMGLGFPYWFTSGNGTLTQDTTTKRSAPFSLKWTPGTTLGSLQYFSVAAEPGAYTLSAWILVPAGSGLTSLDCGIVSYTATGNVGYTSIVSTNYPITVYDTWFRITQTIPSMAAGIVALGPKIIPHGSGIFYIDDVQLERGSTATTVFPLDSVVASQSHGTALNTTDLTSLSETVSRIRLSIKGLSDNAPAVDAGVVTHETVTRPLTESAPAVGTLSRTFTPSRSLTDSEPATDVVTRLFARLFLKNVSETLTTSDITTLTNQLSAVLFDSAPLTDALVSNANYGQQVAESLPQIEALVGNFIAARASTDTAPAVAALTRGFSQGRSLLETTTVSDNTARGVTSARSRTDAAPATDAVTGRGGVGRSISESLTTGPGTVVRLVTFPRLMSQGTAIFEAPTRTFAAARSLTDATSLTEAAFRRSVALVRGSSDNAAGTDAVGRASTQTRGMSEATLVSDTVTRSGSAPVARFFTDIAHGTDALTRGKGNTRAVTDVAQGTDAAARLLLVYVGLGVSAPATDQVARHLVTSRGTTDITAVHESLVRRITGLRVINPAKFGPRLARPTRTAVVASPTHAARSGPTMVET